MPRRPRAGMRPPREIDGAEVVLWAWSELLPFFTMESTDGGVSVPIHGLAICRYAKGGEVSRLSCNSAWETENDSPFSSLEDAAKGHSAQYDIGSIGNCCGRPPFLASLRRPLAADVQIVGRT